MNIFRLTHNDYCPTTYLFTGPEDKTQSDFEQTCKQLLPKAALLELQEKRNMDDFVYWEDVVRKLTVLLEDAGFPKFNPNSFEINAVGLIENDKQGLLGYMNNVVLAYNLRATTKCDEAMQELVELTEEFGGYDIDYKQDIQQDPIRVNGI